MTEEEQAELLRIVKQIQNSPAMNGAFDRLTESVEHIKNTQTKMCSDVNVVMVKQQEAREKLDDLHVALYDPDKGIYKRINDSIATDVNQEQHLDRLEKLQEDLNTNLEDHSERIGDLEETENNLKKVAGDRMENLDSAVKMEKTARKLIWAGALAFGAFLLDKFGPGIWKLLATLI